MTGAVLAEAIGEVLAEWRRDGYLPRCGVPYPLMPEFTCTHPPHRPDRLHGYEGPFPPAVDEHPTDDEENDR